MYDFRAKAISLILKPDIEILEPDIEIGHTLLDIYEEPKVPKINTIILEFNKYMCY